MRGIERHAAGGHELALLASHCQSAFDWVTLVVCLLDDFSDIRAINTGIFERNLAHFRPQHVMIDTKFQYMKQSRELLGGTGNSCVTYDISIHSGNRKGEEKDVTLENTHIFRVLANLPYPFLRSDFGQNYSVLLKNMFTTELFEKHHSVMVPVAAEVSLSIF